MIPWHPLMKRFERRVVYRTKRGNMDRATAKEERMRIGFIGLGTMGGRMAASLRNAGHEMYVNDIRPEAVAPHTVAGAIEMRTARDVGAAADVVFTSLPGPAEFTDV